MLKLENIKVTFNPDTVNEKHALRGVDLFLEHGDFVTIIGSNGAGKSTLFSVISGERFPEEGRVILGDKDITFTPEYKRSHEIGRLFQDPLKGTAPSMTIEENLALAYLKSQKGSSFARVSKADRVIFREKLAQLELGLEDRMKIPVGLLSGGQRQALTLMMATLVPPKVLLLDEHTAALDPATAEKIINLTKNIVAENNLTCMMITHNIPLALSMGNRTIMMNEGKIIKDLKGDTRKDITVPELLQVFRENANKELNNDRMLLSL